MDIAIKAIMIFAAALIPTGIVLGLYYDQPAWFLLTVLGGVFFAAG